MKTTKHVYVISHQYKDNKEVAFRIDGVYLDHKKAEHEYTGFVENNKTAEYTLQSVEMN